MSVEKKVAPNRSQEAVKVSAPGRVQQARKDGPHADAVHADGRRQSEATEHKPPLKGKPGVGDGVTNKY